MVKWELYWGNYRIWSKQNMIKIKTDNLCDTEFQNAIIKKIHEITNANPSISIASTGGKLTSLEIDDKKLSESKKTKLKEYINGLE